MTNSFPSTFVLAFTSIASLSSSNEIPSIAESNISWDITHAALSAIAHEVHREATLAALMAARPLDISSF